MQNSLSEAQQQPDGGSSENLRAMHQANLGLIQQLIEITARRRRLDEEDTQEFGSYVHEKIMDGDYRILHKFKGKSSIRTYLTIVIQRLFQDYRNQIWGKWRPSAAAQRLGEKAVLLERLVSRDGYSYEQAFQLLTTNHQIEMPRQDFEELVRQLPVRLPRVKLSDETLRVYPAEEHSGNRRFAREAWARTVARIQPAMRSVLGSLTEEDRRILNMCYFEGCKISQIARVLNLDAGKLYKRLQKLLKSLRKALRKKGINQEDLAEVIGKSYGSIYFELNTVSEKRNSHPSNPYGEPDGDPS